MSTDFYPTIVEMAGIRKDPGNPVDGLSLVPLLRGESELPREALYWHYPHYSNQGGKPSGAIRQGPWKLIEFYGEDRIELYNLDEDLSEQHNLAPKYPERVQSMRQKLHDWLKEVGARMPQHNPNYDPKREWEGLGWMQRCT